MFVNHHKIPQLVEIPVNDNDYIGIGGNVTRKEANGDDKKRVFLYKVKAPLNWNRAPDDLDENEVESEAGIA